MLYRSSGQHIAARTPTRTRWPHLILLGEFLEALARSAWPHRTHQGGCSMYTDRPPKWRKWRFVPSVTHKEAVALSLNIEPTAVEWEDGEPFGEDEEFFDRFEVLRRVVLNKPRWTAAWLIRPHTKNPQLNLAHFAKWAQATGWQIPEELSALATSQVDYTVWTGRPVWTLAETACLLAGIEPVPVDQIQHRHDSNELFTELVKAIDRKKLPFKPSPTSKIADVRILASDGIRWAIKSGYPIPKLFRTTEKASSTVQAPPQASVIRHTTTLLKAVDAVTKEFWSNSKSSSKPPSQTTIMKWLMTSFKPRLGATEARSVDRVCRPDAIRNRQKRGRATAL
jgi:hypothetical protein